MISKGFAKERSDKSLLACQRGSDSVRMLMIDSSFFFLSDY